MRICTNCLFYAGMSKQSLYCIHIRSLRQIKRCCTVSQVMHSDYICHTGFLHLPVHLGFNSYYNYREYSGILRIFIQTIHISLLFITQRIRQINPPNGILRFRSCDNILFISSVIRFRDNYGFPHKINISFCKCQRLADSESAVILELEQKMVHCISLRTYRIQKFQEFFMRPIPQHLFFSIQSSNLGNSPARRPFKTIVSFCVVEYSDYLIVECSIIAFRISLLPYFILPRNYIFRPNRIYTHTCNR